MIPMVSVITFVMMASMVAKVIIEFQFTLFAKAMHSPAISSVPEFV